MRRGKLCWVGGLVGLWLVGEGVAQEVGMVARAGEAEVAEAVEGKAAGGEAELVPQRRERWLARAGASRFWRVAGVAGWAESEFSTLGSEADTELVLWHQETEDLPWRERAANDDCFGLSSRLRWTLGAGEFRLEVRAKSAGAAELVWQEAAQPVVPWMEPEPPGNDTREGAWPVVVGEPMPVRLLAAGADTPALSGPTVWFAWQRPANWPLDQRLRVELSGPGGPLLAVFAGDADAATGVGTVTGERSVLTLEAPEQLKIAVGAEAVGRGTGWVLSLAAVEKLANDRWTTAQELAGPLPLEVTAETDGATQDDVETTIEANGAGVWFVYRAQAAGELELTTAGSDFDTQLAVYTRAGDGLEQQAFNDDDPQSAQTDSRVRLVVEAGQELLVCVVGFNGAQGQLALRIGVVE